MAKVAYRRLWLILFEKPINSKITIPGIAKLPIPKDRLWAKPYKLKTLVLFALSVFSASQAPLEAEKAASETPSRTAATIRITGDFVNAKTTRVNPETTLPIMRVFLRPYLSAANPKGMLTTKVVIPIIVITKPIKL